jgi:hypothetical protein
MDQKHPEDKLRILRKLATEMKMMMETLESQGEDLPFQFIPGMHNYLAIFESNLQISR